MSYLYETRLTLDLFDNSGVRIIPHKTMQENAEAFYLHCHEQIELIRVEDGCLYAEIGGEKRALRSGDVLIFSPNVTHKGYTENEKATYSTVIFDIRKFYNETEASEKYIIPLFESLDSLVEITEEAAVLDALDFLIESKENGAHPLETVGCVYRLLASLWTYCAVHTEQNRYYEMVKSSIEYIEKNYTNEISIPEMCEYIGYSPSYFSKKFKQIVGMTPSNYITKYRVEAGYRLIVNGQSNILWVSEQCGFSDQNYFARCFKKHFGHPPTYYLKK